MATILQAENLDLWYGQNHALHGVTIDLPEHEITALIGPSGCGKSTLLSLIAGLLSPTDGSILTAPDTTLGYMLQKDSLLPWRSIRQNVCLGAEIQKKPLSEATATADALLHTYGLWEFRNCYPKELSGGMRQRAALIRTLVTQPKLLLLDEPFSALDYQTRLAVSDDIHRILRQEKKAAVLVTHDISEAISMSDRVIVLTRRPAVVKSEYPILFSGGEATPLTRRDAPEFGTYFNEIWRDIDVHL